MDTVRRNVGWIGLLLSVTAGGVGLYARATLAETQARISVLEAQREEIAARLARIEAKQDRLIEMHIPSGGGR